MIILISIIFVSILSKWRAPIWELWDTIIFILICQRIIRGLTSLFLIKTKNFIINQLHNRKNALQCSLPEPRNSYRQILVKIWALFPRRILHQFVYIFVLWIFQEIPLGDGPKNSRRGRRNDPINFSLLNGVFDIEKYHVTSYRWSNIDHRLWAIACAKLNLYIGHFRPIHQNQSTLDISCFRSQKQPMIHRPFWPEHRPF